MDPGRLLIFQVGDHTYTSIWATQFGVNGLNKLKNSGYEMGAESGRNCAREVNMIKLQCMKLSNNS